MYIYRQSTEPPWIYTVGFYLPNGQWIAESDHDTAAAAADRCHFLNGGK